MARRSKRAEHDNQDRWLVSYADFVTLLFAFFVVMYSISSVNEGKYKVFSNSLSEALSNQPSPESQLNQQEQMLKTLVDRRTARLAEQQRKAEEQMRALTEGLSQVMQPMVKEGLVGIRQTNRGVVIDISASTLFRTGEAILQADALEVMRKVAQVLSKDGQIIEVEGHTDDVPIKTAQFPSNWELSSARASSVARLLIENGVVEQRLAVVGLASNQPLAPNNSVENRARNRRVTINVVTANMARGGEDNAAGAKQP